MALNAAVSSNGIGIPDEMVEEIVETLFTKFGSAKDDFSNLSYKSLRKALKYYDIDGLLGEHLLNAEELVSAGSFQTSQGGKSRESSLKEIERNKSAGRSGKGKKGKTRRQNSTIKNRDEESWANRFNISLRSFWLAVFIAANVGNFSGKWLSYSAGWVRLPFSLLQRCGCAFCTDDILSQFGTGVSSGGFAFAGTAEQHCVQNGRRFIASIQCNANTCTGFDTMLNATLSYDAPRPGPDNGPGQIVSLAPYNGLGWCSDCFSHVLSNGTTSLEANENFTSKWQQGDSVAPITMGLRAGVYCARSFGQNCMLDTFLLLLPVCRGLMTEMRKITGLWRYIPIDDAILSHQVIGIAMGINALGHVGAHLYNYHIYSQACPAHLLASKVGYRATQPDNNWYGFPVSETLYLGINRRTYADIIWTLPGFTVGFEQSER